jgi:hypothetical protein
LACFTYETIIEKFKTSDVPIIGGFVPLNGGGERKIMKIYNKLIRDRIPEIMEANGVVYSVRELSGQEYVERLYGGRLRTACAEKGGNPIMIRSFFGWERPPFTREVETRNLPRSVRFEECVARLQYMMMTRSIGCGKSLAIRCLKDRVDANKYRFL